MPGTNVADREASDALGFDELVDFVSLLHIYFTDVYARRRPRGTLEILGRLEADQLPRLPRPMPSSMMVDLAIEKVWPKFYKKVGGKAVVDEVVKELEKARASQK